jgi:heterodisulfide reductase subunit D
MNTQVKSMAEMAAAGESPEILFWVGCAGSYDARAQKVTLAFAEILQKAGISFAVLGNEERCTGDPARRAGNEFVFQMLALQNIETLNMYEVKKIVTACPHCFNTLKNEYPALGGHYEVIHHTQLIHQLIAEGRVKMKEGGAFKGKRITYHDSCYLGARQWGV